MKILILLGLVYFFSGCQLGYIFKSAKNQFSMMASREDINEVLKKNDLTPEEKQKLLLSQEAREFAFNKLHLKKTDNYSTFIQLNRPYVTWVVHAAEKWQMKNYEWSYPFVGNMPYKGFFTEKEALEEADELAKKQNLDTFVRGVSAYSTLGYFSDSVLSSMLRYQDYDLVNTIIHETVHTTLYIKNNADFNERLAVFIGNKGTEIFYLQREGPQSETLKKIKADNEDELLFSQFISKEILTLSDWYKAHTTQDEDLRQQQFEKIKTDFSTDLQPKLKTKNYEGFNKRKINNAYLGLYKTYNQNLDNFEVIYKKYNSDLIKFIEVVKKLESSKDPEKDLLNL